VLRIALPASPSQPRASTTILASASSDGKILLYDLFALPPSPEASADVATSQLAHVAEYDSVGSRLTCVALAEDGAMPQPEDVEDAEVVGQKRKAHDDQGSETDSVDPDADEDEEEDEVEDEAEDEAEDEET
jgi:protein MAK11